MSTSLSSLSFRRRGASVLLGTGMLFSLPGLAASERYVIDPEHTFPSLEFSHMGISVWRGKFNSTSGSIEVDSAARTGKVSVQVDPASISFGLDSMDESARSDSFLNVARFPEAGYEGKLVFEGDKPVAVDGQIRFMGMTKPLRLTINSFNCIEHPMLKKQVCGADAQGETNWGEYGMKMSEYGQGEAGRVLLRIQVEALKQD